MNELLAISIFIRFTVIVSLFYFLNFIWHSQASPHIKILFGKIANLIFYIYGNGSNSLMCSASHGKFRIFSSAMNKCAIMLMMLIIIMTHMNNKQFFFPPILMIVECHVSTADAFRNTDFEKIIYEIIILNYFGKKNFLCMQTIST